jgi:hypothetical protein
MGTTFQKALEILINQSGMDNQLNTPDYILAECLLNCLSVYNTARELRDKHGVKDPTQNLNYNESFKIVE